MTTDVCTCCGQPRTAPRPPLTVRQAAEAAGVTHTTILRWIRDGRLQVTKDRISGRHGFRYLIPADQLDTLISS